MGTIGRRIETAVKHLANRDYENALIQVCIAIDATAKKKWRSYGPGRRIKSFVKEYETLIYQFATSGGLILAGGSVSFGAELPDILYKSVRCVLHHGDELSKHVVIQENWNTIGIDKGKFILNTGYIYGFLFSVVIDDVNSNEQCNPNLYFSFNKTKIIINDAWGDLNYIENLTGYNKVF